jgi:hypothetical protein
MAGPVAHANARRPEYARSAEMGSHSDAADRGVFNDFARKSRTDHDRPRPRHYLRLGSAACQRAPLRYAPVHHRRTSAVR